MLTLSSETHVPFTQPFLVFHTNEGGWTIDVAGKIELYVDPNPLKELQRHGSGEMGLVGEKLNLAATATMKTLALELSRVGIKISRIGIAGPGSSSGPSHILRNGAFFRREARFEKQQWPDGDLSWYQ